MAQQNRLRPICIALLVIAIETAAWSGAAIAQTSRASIRGVVRSVEQATVSTNEPLLVIKIGVREGDHFRRGDVLVAFDCDRQQAERGAATAALREAELNLESGRKLDQYKAIGKIDLKIAEARRNRAWYELAALTARLKDCKFSAPFDGRVTELTVRQFERTVAQRPYLTIVRAGELEIETIVPSALLAVIRIGSPFEFRIDELAGAPVRAKVKTIGAAVDPVSKTIKVIGTFESPSGGFLTGMSGTIVLKEQN